LYSRATFRHGCWGPQPIDCVIGGPQSETGVLSGWAIIGSPCIHLVLHHPLRLHTTVYSINVPSNCLIICWLKHKCYLSHILSAHCGFTAISPKNALSWIKQFRVQGLTMIYMILWYNGLWYNVARLCIFKLIISTIIKKKILWFSWILCTVAIFLCCPWLIVILYISVLLWS